MDIRTREIPSLLKFIDSIIDIRPYKVERIDYGIDYDSNGNGFHIKITGVFPQVFFRSIEHNPFPTEKKKDERD